MVSAGRRSWRALELSEAEAFERYMVPLLLGPLAECLLDALGLTAGNRLLDLACGTGAVAKPALERIEGRGRVVGLDIDADALAIARDSSPHAIEYVLGSSERLPFPAGSFDAVACQQGLQFFDDREQALNEVRRVLVPAGRVAFIVWASVDQQPVFGAIRQALIRVAGSEAGGKFFERPSSLGAAYQLERTLHSAGFVDVSVEDLGYEAGFPSVLDFLEQYAAATPLGNTLAALPPADRDALVADVETALPDGRLFVRYRLATARNQPASAA